MHVLQVVHALPEATYGGTELYTTWLAEALAEDGHEVAVATPRGAETEIEGASVHELPDPADWIDASGMDSGLEGGVVHESVDAAFEDLLESVDPDLVHFQHLKYASATLPVHCRERGVPTVFTLHDFWTMCHRGQLHQPDGRPCAGPESVAKCTACYGEAVRRAGDAHHVANHDLRADGEGCSTDGAEQYGQPRGDVVEPTEGSGPGPADPDDPSPGGQRADVAARTEVLTTAREAVDLLISPSSFLRGKFVEYGTPADAIVKCRNGIRTGNYRDTGFDPTDGLRVGFAGRISPEKGVHVLLEAFAGVEGEDAELIVFGTFDPGSNDYHARLRDAADDRVTFYGFYEENAAPAARADVLVVPSLWYENSPLVIQEAFASRIPVVAGDFGGMAEMVRDGRDGLTFPAGDPAALAERLQRLVDDPQLVRDLRRGIDPPKDVGTHAEEIGSLYEAVRQSVARRERDARASRDGGTGP